MAIRVLLAHMRTRFSSSAKPLVNVSIIDKFLFTWLIVIPARNDLRVKVHKDTCVIYRQWSKPFDSVGWLLNCAI